MRGKLALLLALMPSPALAQAYQCTPPARLPSLSAPRPDGPVRRTPIARYTLAVSWSPEFCRGGRRDPVQCSGRNGRFGFVLHGLWPEAASAPPPQWCSLTPRPSPELIRRQLCSTPVPWLIEHEWAKHGSCMARTPEAYYRASNILWRSLRWPDADRLSRRPELTVGELRRELVLAKPALRREGIRVVLSRSGWLREVQLCYSRRFMPAQCPPRQRGAADSTPLKIWRGL